MALTDEIKQQENTDQEELEKLINEPTPVHKAGETYDAKTGRFLPGHNSGVKKKKLRDAETIKQILFDRGFRSWRSLSQNIWNAALNGDKKMIEFILVYKLGKPIETTKTQQDITIKAGLGVDASESRETTIARVLSDRETKVKLLEANVS